MTKKSPLKTVLSMTAAAAMMFGIGCSEDEQKNEKPQEKAKTEQKATVEQKTEPKKDIQQERIEAIYETMRTMDCNMTYVPYMDKGVMKIGFGTPVENTDAMPMYKENGTSINAATKSAVLEELRASGERAWGYKTDGVYVRKVTKAYLRKAEEKAKKLIPNYESLPVKVQTVVLQTEILTNGKLQTYKNFCKAVTEGRFADAAKECGVKGLKHARFNQSRRDLLIQAEKNKTAAILAAQAAERH